MKLWTAERDELLRELTAAGMMRKEVATVLGCTKNAVCGRAFRLGLPSTRTKKQEVKKAPRRKRPSPRAKRDGGGVRNGLPRRSPPTVLKFDTVAKPGIPVTVAIIDTVEPFTLTIFETKERHCRYMRGEGISALYCGANSRDGSSYCAAHHGLIYTPKASKNAA